MKTSYDEFALLQFVKSSVIQNQSVSIRLLDSLLSGTSDDSVVFLKTVTYLTMVYNNPNSSFRNKILYDKILKTQMVSKWYTAKEKARIVRKFNLIHQNDVGNLANDFEYRTPDGQSKRMYDQEADRFLLFFYNPECDACKQMTDVLKSSSSIANALAKKRLKIFCVYMDEDLSIWYRHLHEFPQQWIHGRDENEFLYKNDIYDLRAIPTIYLLDQNKRVILKDCTSIEELEQNI